MLNVYYYIKKNLDRKFLQKSAVSIFHKDTMINDLFIDHDIMWMLQSTVHLKIKFYSLFD